MNMNVFAKGNALVAKGSTSDAVYVNNCLDEIFKQLSVNRQHIDLFYALYMKLLDRLFGEDVLRSIDISANPTWVKGVTGGWLRALMSVSTGSNGSSFDLLSQRSQSSGRGTNACYIDSLSHPLSSILHKFAPQSPMFDLLSKIQGGFEIKVALLPTKLQMFIAEHPVYAAMDAHSQPFVGFALLKTPLNAPNQRSHIAHKGALLVDAMELFLICMLRYPTTSHTLLAPHSAVPDFMSSAQGGSRFNPLDTLYNRGPGAWMRGLPYLALLNEYLKLYLPVDGSNTRSPNSDGYNNSSSTAAPLDGNGRGGAEPLHSTSTNTSTRNSVEQTALEAQHAQLFVHLAVAYWVDCALVLRREHGQLGIWRRLLTNISAGGLTDANAGAGMHWGERPHPSPVDTVLVDSASLRWTVASMQCTYLLVMRVLADPQLLERLSLLSDRPDLQPFAAAALHRRTPAQTGVRSNAGLFGNINNSNLEGPQSHWQVLQRPLYEMLRTIFNHGESASVDPQVVSLATEVWLLYLQPWSARPICNGNIGILPTRSSNGLGVYSSEWKPFVAANLHFYTTLFACYMRLVSQRSLSVSEQEGHHHLTMLERVLQVFTPALVTVVDELTRAFKSQYVSLKHSHSSRPGVSSAQSRGLRPNLSSSSLNSNSSNVFQTPGYANQRRAPMTEGYASTAAEGEDAEEGDESNGQNSANNVEPELLRLVKFQHEFLYPDRRIDDLPDCGITDFRKYAAEASVNVVATLHQMNENLSAAQDSVSRMVNQAMADLRTLLGLPPYQGPRNRYSERLLSCIAAVVALVPSASAGINHRGSNSSHGHNGASLGPGGSNGREGPNDAGALRDPYSGRLTEHGRLQILRGQAKCEVLDLLQPRALSVDPLECPLCSYEWAALASGLIVLSKVLNAALSLPADNAHIMCSWETILSRAWASRPPRDLLHPLRVARSAARVNLRFLASIRTLTVLAVLVLYVLYKTAVVSGLMLLISLLGLCYVAYLV